jgi:hypothetical protein
METVGRVEPAIPKGNALDLCFIVIKRTILIRGVKNMKDCENAIWKKRDVLNV